MEHLIHIYFKRKCRCSKRIRRRSRWHICCTWILSWSYIRRKRSKLWWFCCKKSTYGKPICRSNTISKAIALGTDRNSNATLRALEDKINLEVSGLLTQYGVPDIDDDLLNYIYNKRLTGEYGTQTLKEQFRLLVNPDLPGYRDPDLVQFAKENAVGISASKANIYKTEQLLNNQLGPQLGSGFNPEDVKFLSQLQSVPGGADQIKNILQGIWDSSVNDAYKGSSYNLTLASMRPRLIKEGNFDERGRDADFVSELLTLAPEDLNKNARKYFLSINDEGALAKMASSLKGQGLSGVIYNPA